MERMVAGERGLAGMVSRRGPKDAVLGSWGILRLDGTAAVGTDRGGTMPWLGAGSGGSGGGGLFV